MQDDPTTAKWSPQVALTRAGAHGFRIRYALSRIRADGKTETGELSASISEEHATDPRKVSRALWGLAEIMRQTVRVRGQYAPPSGSPSSSSKVYKGAIRERA